MNVRKITSDTGLSVGLIVSTVMHLAVFLLLSLWADLFPIRMKEQQTYFVDICNLPVASPRAGSASQQSPVAEQAPPPEKTPANSMPLQVKTKPASKPAATKVPTKPSDAAPESPAELEERINKIRSKAEAQQQDDAIEKLRRKMAAAGKGRSGIPLAGGTEAGSDYLNYITSRLTEEFREPPNTGRDLFAVIKIKIIRASDRGKVDLLKIMKTSGSIAFDNYAVRSVYEAEKTFPPPPAGNFEFTFKFKPQGISSR